MQKVSLLVEKQIPV